MATAAWFGALLVLNLGGFIVAGLADPAGFDCSDPQVPNRCVLTDVGRWVGAVIGLGLPVALLYPVWWLSRRWWPIPICLVGLVPMVGSWQFVFDGGARIC